MRIVSVNVGKAETIQVGQRRVTTGIRKLPVQGTVWISASAVGDDEVCNSEHHGGPDQAVYAYSNDDYMWWSEQLGRNIEPGSFGENLTVSGLPTDLYVGDRLLIGDVVLEATAPRIPCDTFAAHMQSQTFGVAFRRAERPGIYFRVMNEGEVTAGDKLVLVDNTERQVSILELYRFAYDLHPEASDLQRFLEAPLARRLRAKIKQKLLAINQ